ncbi:MAG: D-aminoacyl-tRNA deacylase [bacterium]|nr:D-aminoacyl-tRNA deacylase [bacterium]
MRVVVQRVKRASCEINEEIISQIGSGFLILIGVEKGDKPQSAKYLAHKCANLRIFEDSYGKMNLSLKEIKGGEVLVISQFTLCADCKKGLRPSFDYASSPDQAIALYKKFIEFLRSEGVTVKEGVFGERMSISLINEGPVTFILST